MTDLTQVQTSVTTCLIDNESRKWLTLHRCRQALQPAYVDWPSDWPGGEHTSKENAISHSVPCGNIQVPIPPGWWEGESALGRRIQSTVVHPTGTYKFPSRPNWSEKSWVIRMGEGSTPSREFNLHKCPPKGHTSPKLPRTPIDVMESTYQVRL